MAMEHREPSDSEKQAECFPHNGTPDTWKKLNKMDDWSKENVYEWLMKLKVPQEYAKMLLKEDVSGAALILFKKKDLIDVGLKHGPAVQILENVALFNATSKNVELSAIPNDTDASIRASAIQHFQQDKATAESPAVLESSTQFSIQENMGGKSSVQRWSEDKHGSSGGESSYDESLFQDKKDELLEEQDDGRCIIGDGGNGVQSLALPLLHCPNQTNNMENETEEHRSNFVNHSGDMSKSSVLCWCKPRPFDESSITFEYVQYEILPPETGPSNLIDPVHEYKLMANTENVFKKFRDETCWFAAACLNSRTNGTIHFGVGDEPQYKHGQIIGLEVASQSTYIDEFYKGLDEHFKVNTKVAKACIRPPKFVQVKCSDHKDKWVIEIDVVPMCELTEKKLFYTTIDKKRRELKCLFIRSGASTVNYLPQKDKKVLNQNKKTLKRDLELWVSCRRLAENNGSLTQMAHFIRTYRDREVHETVMCPICHLRFQNGAHERSTYALDVPFCRARAEASSAEDFCTRHSKRKKKLQRKKKK